MRTRSSARVLWFGPMAGVSLPFEAVVMRGWGGIARRPAAAARRAIGACVRNPVFARLAGTPVSAGFALIGPIGAAGAGGRDGAAA